MLFLLLATAVLATGTAVLLFVVQGGLRRASRRKEGFWRRFLLRQLLLLPLLYFGVLPCLLGVVGSRMVRTRHDEASYGGPAFDGKGNWIVQDRTSLRSGPPQHAVAPSLAKTLRLASLDGTALRAFLVPTLEGRPHAVAVLVHGLFRSAMEVEPVAVMLRELDVEVLLLELANHGGSGRRRCTFGKREKDDVLAAVAYLRQRKGGFGAPLLLFGVSLGGVAAALAAPEIPELGGLVLDAPMTAMSDTAYRQLARFGFPRVFSHVALWSLECASGVDLDAIRPVDALRALPPTLPSLLVGAGHDYRVPPEVVRAAFAALRAPEGRKELWVAPESRHGQVWLDRPAEYRQRLTALLARMR
ncbi:MAG: alpha/beta fold hydrolase [Planctomycetes bacterium]|nr:alpha/beta fold hydrolase [Planctomycetota bacterium]MCB9869106.1 alpha/beta fold hydrolase [Planctomycetota bacterium]MCB9889279.1 alpha/beta fold hydrolase [Planctomycetota bacterium]